MKFEIGEMAVIVKDFSGNLPHVVGIDVEIVIDPPSDKYIYDYVTKDSAGNIWYCLESELKKKKPPEEDIKEIDWVKLCNLKVLEKA